MPAFINNGPDIPERLLQAHEEGRVVFFCGAGISIYPAGLPSFYSLVDKVYKQLGVFPNNIQKTAIKLGQLDTAIGLLEGDIAGGRIKVRKKVEELLQIKSVTQTSLIIHETLLKLARNKDGKTRLITTNFDRLFEHVISNNNLEVARFDAPLLPVPKNKWDGLVYLHGILQESSKESDLERLVLSSGDFGLAYLTERWAARFISELFRNFTVCFIGYSINDPVMRYMLDAYAADRLLGESPLEMFAFGNYAKGKENISKEAWQAKHVTPILYKNHHNHYYLRQTLINWAKTYSEGGGGKKMIIATYASNPPLTSAKSDYVTGRILWALTDELAAKHFADLDPVPPLEWLEPLSEYFFTQRDLPRFGVTSNNHSEDDLKFSLVDRPTPYHLASWMSLTSNSPFCNQWDNVEIHIAHWLVRHLNDPKLIYWIISKRGRLNDSFASLIKRQILKISKLETDNSLDELEKITEGAPAAIPSLLMKRLWQLLLSGKADTAIPSFNIYDWVQRFRVYGLIPTLRIELSHLLEPYVVLRRPSDYFIEQDSKSEPQKLNEIVNSEVKINLDGAHSFFEDLKEDKQWKRSLPQLFSTFSTLLKDCLDLQQELGSIDEKNDFSYIHLPSISEHDQNQHLEDWSVLIELTRDSWLATATQSREHAILYAETWNLTPFPLYKRLAFFAGTFGDIIPSEKALNWLLSDDSRWLWSRETQREAIRLMVSLFLNTDDKHLKDKLECSILQGPQREMYDQDISNMDWQKLVDEKILLRLSKILTEGGTLSNVAITKYTELRMKNLEFVPADNDLDEFAFRMLGNNEGIQFIPTPRDQRELVNWLIDYPSQDFRVEDDWRKRCKDDFIVVFQALYELKQQNIIPVERWREALQEWSQSPELLKESWNHVPNILLSFPDTQFNEIAHTLGWWLQKQAKEFLGQDEVFIALVMKLLDTEFEGVVDNTEGVVGSAINHPIGYATQSVIDWWYRQELKDSQGMDKVFLTIFTKIIDQGVSHYIYGRVLLAAHVITFYRVDEEWSKDYLLPLFSWQRSKIEASAAWKGFLWSPRIYPPLFDKIKNHLFDTVLHYDLLGKAGKQYASLMTYVALNFSDMFSSKELARLTLKLPSEGLNEVSSSLMQAFKAAKDKSEYWRQQLNPYILNVWPKSSTIANQTISANFCKICLVSGDLFPDVFEELKVWLIPINHPNYLIRQCNKAKLGEKYPSSVLELLDVIIGDKCGTLLDDLQKCLDSIINADKRLFEDSKYQRLIILYEKNCLQA